MGRIRRQRSLKDVDPFSKEEDSRGAKLKKKDKQYDLAPKYKDDRMENDKIPKKSRQLMALSKVISEKTKKRKKKKTAESNSTQRKKGETKKQYFRRLDGEVNEALNKAMMQTKKLRGKRKDHLKKRDEKLKSKKSNTEWSENESKNPSQDIIKFGEVVSQPPSISAVPRKAKTKTGSSDLKLASLLKGESKEKVTQSTFKRKEMTESMKRIHDQEREKVISEYRKLKQRRKAKS
eukprot:Seg3062.1 transcript_id=Seg3062.1/GoldUCD/mRNA.D3Y31 product="Coiled-coil domain-containing protein 137" protein_id=Seg3062.1/GoldUCD/D3Y31